MPIQYPEIMSLVRQNIPVSWSDREVMLYALGVGMGSSRSAPELRFVYERGLKVMPTFASTVMYHADPGDFGIDPTQVLHGEQAIEFRRLLPVNASLIADSRVAGVHDKGREKGAIIRTEITLKDALEGEVIAILRSAIVARADGGFGGPTDPMPPAHPVPDRAADLAIEFEIPQNQALIYRLLGDRNPLHADPLAARAAGFEIPILHGLCTYGITCRAVLAAFANYDPALMKSHAARFAAPVYPGEILTVLLWRDGDVISFEASVRARGITVIKHGRSVLCSPLT